jgi:hypothetical protein
MYSPKISEDLIPHLYKLRCMLGIPMTQIVNKVLETFLERFITSGEFSDFEIEQKMSFDNVASQFSRILSNCRNNRQEVIKLLKKVA